MRPLARRTWSLAHDRNHLELHIHWGLAYYHFARPHQSLTRKVRGPSKYRYRTPAMAAALFEKDGQCGIYFNYRSLLSIIPKTAT